MTKRKLNILIIEDQKDVRDLVTTWLVNAGHRVDTAADGNEAIPKLKKGLDLVLLDVMMPGPRPNEIVEKVTEKSPKAIVIYLTAVETFNLTPEQARMGWRPVIKPPVKGYIKKPIDEYMLLKKIDEVFQRQEALSKIKKPKKKRK